MSEIPVRNTSHTQQQNGVDTDGFGSDAIDSDITSRYQRAEKLEQGVSTKKIAFNTTLYPHWIGETDYFWYIREAKTGKQYRLVKAETATNTEAFDHLALAKSLSAAIMKSTSSEKKIDPTNLPLDNLEFNPSRTQISFTAFNKQWRYNESDKSCQETWGPPQNCKISPDGARAVFVRNDNLWVCNLASGEESQLTRDGEKFYRYASTPTVFGRQEQITLEVLWSPDSKRLFTQVIDTRDIEIGAPLVQHVPPDGSLRPRILDADRRVAFPCDPEVESYRFLSINVDSGHSQYADYRSCPVFYPPYAGYFSGGRGWWDEDCRHTYFIDQERGGRILRLLRFDTHTGQTRILIEEASDDPITLIPISHIRTLVVPLPESDELIWYSGRSGWAHLYLYELSTGTLKNIITKKDSPTDQGWLVRNLLHFDADRRELFIQTAGRVAGRNPYYCDICRVNIDTGKLTPLLSTDHEYIVCDQSSRVSFSDTRAKGVSPTGNYVITTRSRVDEIPVSLLLDRDGNEVMTLETADISGLPDGWRWPEPVMLKAEDGATDIYGVVFRPSDFSPKKSYPVLDCTYGYSAPVGSFTNNSVGNWIYLSASAYAELGFVVVMINNRGNDEGLRENEFNNHQDPRLPLNPMLPVKYHKGDCVAGITQLAERYPYMDLNRVGVTEFVTIPTAITGMLVYPEFYKVGVSLNPMSDWRMFGAEGMEGGDWPLLEDFAGNLRGKLLMIAGMVDNVVPVAMTLRLVEALQKANKNFDMLLLPNLKHDSCGYATRRAWDHFVKHLQRIEPPKNFTLTTGLEIHLQEITDNGE